MCCLLHHYMLLLRSFHHKKEESAAIKRLLTDPSLKTGSGTGCVSSGTVYLQNSGFTAADEVTGMRFWGSPYSPRFGNWAFATKDKDDAAKVKLFRLSWLCSCRHSSTTTAMSPQSCEKVFGALPTKTLQKMLLQSPFATVQLWSRSVHLCSPQLSTA